MAKRAITLDYLNALEPGPKRIAIPLPHFSRGLYFYLTPHGAASWVFRGRVKGEDKPRTVTIGRYEQHAKGQLWTKSAAMAEADRLRGLCESGKIPTAIYAPVVTPVEPALPVVKVVTVGQVWGEYYRIYVDPPQVIGAVRQGKAESYARMQLYYWTKYIAPQLADVPLAAMDTAAIERFLDGVTGLKGRPIPTTVNRIQSLLSKMFTWAKRRYPKEIPSHPVLGREKNVEETRKRRLTEDEVKLWAKGWLHSDNPDKYALLFSLLTGCRVGVVMGFQPSWITPTHLAIPERVQGVKNCRFVIVQSVAQPLMAKIPSGLTYSRLSGCFINICENSGIFLKIMVDDKPQTISPHSLRKTFRSIAGDIGESDDLVEALISHKNGRGKVTEAYLIRSLPPLVPVAERISQYIINLLGIDPASL